MSLQDPNGTPDEKLAKMRGELGKDQTQKYIKIMLEKSLRQEAMNNKLIEMMRRTGNVTGGFDSSRIIQNVKDYATDPFYRATANAGAALKAKELANKAQLKISDSVKKYYIEDSLRKKHLSYLIVLYLFMIITLEYYAWIVQHIQ